MGLIFLKIEIPAHLSCTEYKIDRFGQMVYNRFVFFPHISFPTALFFIRFDADKFKFAHIEQSHVC